MKSFVYLPVFALIFTLSSFTIQDAYAAADANSITLDAFGTATLKKAVTKGTPTFEKGTYDNTIQITADIDSVNAKGIPTLSNIAGTFVIDGNDFYEAEFTKLKLTIDKKLKLIKWTAKEGSGQFKFLDALDFTENTDQEGTKSTIKIKVGKASFAPKVSASSIGIAIADDTEAPIWSPKTTWNWQLTGNFNLVSAIQVFDIDLFDTDISTVNEIHAQGSKAICYISVGSWEDFRPDAADFPSSVLGKTYAGYPDEKWLDIRALDIIGPIIEKRLDMCKEKGFDAVEPDNIDGYQNDTGFPLTYQDQINFNKWLADEAHERGLLIGLKNDPDQASELHSSFDWALTEDCYVDGWCEDMSIFINEGKAVFQTEYTDTGVTTEDFCPQSKTLQFSGILKDRELDAAFTACN